MARHPVYLLTMSTLSAFDVDLTLFPNQLTMEAGDFITFDNDYEELELIPLEVLAFPNFCWLTTWLNKAKELIHDAPVLCPKAMDPSDNYHALIREILDGRWWKTIALKEHLEAHPELDSIIWADDDLDRFSDDVQWVQGLFPDRDWLLIQPVDLRGLEDHHMIQMRKFIAAHN